MIVTVTPNPSLDRTLEVERLVVGEVLRSSTRRVEPGGKGINVARTLHGQGIATRAVLPVGGTEGDQIVALLQAQRLPVAVVPIAEPVRANVTVVEPDGTTTKLNEPGPRLQAVEVEELLQATLSAAEHPDWIVASGSLPPGCPDDFFAQLVVRARAVDVPVAVDTSGAPLRRALQAGPRLCKPNHDELGEWAGRPLPTLGEVVDVARELQATGIEVVLVSLGAQGAVLVDDVGVLHAERPVAAPRSSVGAGDATLAGYLAAVVHGREAALRSAVAHGAAAVALPGSQTPGPTDLHPDLVVVRHDVDRSRTLGERDRASAGVLAPPA